ncbi:GIY-YIG nuclease family protein [Actinoplanes sp. NPDC051470]|uniref:GIY-YIG nuclease family protein n=1 Tax=Actinoplanes sp. NPDC051470 TaxID=3157224 RepID=UPI003448DCDB
MPSREPGRSIRIFLIDRTPTGRRLSGLSQWTGGSFDFARSDYNKARTQTELKRTGVYILVGPNEGDGKETRIYIGESNVIRVRIDKHHIEKDFWSRAFVFTSNAESLNKAHVLYLEARLLELARAAGVAAIDNDTEPEAEGRLSEPEQADMDAYLNEMLVLLPVLGLSVFEAPAAQTFGADRTSTGGSTTSARKYELQAGAAQAVGYDGPSGFLVTKGASGPTAQKVMSPSYSTLRARLVETKVLQPQGENYILGEDYLFGSPSAAASVIAGRSLSGNVSWKDEQGLTLGQNRSATATEPIVGSVDEVDEDALFGDIDLKPDAPVDDPAK